jgi:pseudaminic acid synthase
MSSMKIAGIEIGLNAPPFVIAEMSGNHNQLLDRALEIVEAAAKTGVQAMKLQTYTADTMTLDIAENEFVVSDPKSLWAGRTLYDLYQEAYTPWEWHKPIMDRCKALGMVCFSTPFDATAVDFLESLDVPCYKIASFENVDLPLIRKVAATGKPLIMSTGMTTLAELDEAVTTAREVGCKDLVLLKCTTNYPADPLDSNLLTIPHMRELFKCEIGLSDHTMGVGAPVASVALGATVIEKHFTLCRADGGVDSAFSLEPAELTQLMVETRRAWQALGKVNYEPTAAELKSICFRRTLYIVEDIAAGTLLTERNVRAIRPGLGMHTKHLETVLGKTVKRAVKKGTPLSFDLLG